VKSKDELKVGAYYFFVTYEDTALTVPVIETLRFKNEVSSDRGETLFVFDRVGEHQPPQCRLTEELLHTVYEFDGASSRARSQPHRTTCRKATRPSVSR
jgi:hypothetical protein